VRQQVAFHKQFFGFPRSNAAAERILDWIDKRFGRRRRYSLRNAARLQLVLALVRAFHAGQADLATFAGVVKTTGKSARTSISPGRPATTPAIACARSVS
jgi:hypothetical protein